MCNLNPVFILQPKASWRSRLYFISPGPQFISVHETVSQFYSIARHLNLQNYFKQLFWARAKAFKLRELERQNRFSAEGGSEKERGQITQRVQMNVGNELFFLLQQHFVNFLTSFLGLAPLFAKTICCAIHKLSSNERLEMKNRRIKHQLSIFKEFRIRPFMAKNFHLFLLHWSFYFFLNVCLFLP